NPPLAQSCGLEMTLVIDSSGSINTTELATMKTAFNAFIDAFLPGTPTEMAVVEFDSTAAVTQGFTDDTTLLHSAINAASSGGNTNWDDALSDAHGLFPNRIDKPDVIVFASDGNPTASDGPLSHLEDAIVEANAVKADGIHIIALGIGSDLDVDSLYALSTPDSVITSAFDTLAADLAALAEELCGGTITVHKVVDADGDLNTTGDQTDGTDWTFSANADSPDFATPASGDTDGDGLINFDIDLGDDDTATVDIAETPEAGYALLDASCTDQEQQAVGSTGVNAVHDITLGKADIVSCVFYNVPAGKIIIEKQTEPDGDQTMFEFDPSYASSFALLDGQQNDSGFTLSPGTYSVSEVSESGWQLTNVTCSDGSTPDAITVSSGETVTCVFTNTIDELCTEAGDDVVINENLAYVVNSVGSSANSGGNSSNGGNGGDSGTGGGVYGSDNDGNTTGAGGSSGNGGAGGTITTGEALTGTTIGNSLNYNDVTIDRCGCGCSGCGDDIVVNTNLGFVANGTGSASNSGTSDTDGGSSGSSGNGGSVAGSDNDDNTTGAGSSSGNGGAGGTVRTGAAASLTGIGNSVNTNVTRIRR
ncbi:MAG: vWA domain-containing protein, partial [Patescibacteria group bacterium]